MRYRGRVRFEGEETGDLDVSIEVDSSHVRLLSGEESLGSWCLADVVASRVVANEFELDLGDEKILFLAEDQVNFAYGAIQDMAEGWARYHSMNVIRRSRAVAAARRKNEPSRLHEAKRAFIAAREVLWEEPAPAGSTESVDSQTEAIEESPSAPEATTPGRLQRRGAGLLSRLEATDRPGEEKQAETPPKLVPGPGRLFRQSALTARAVESEEAAASAEPDPAEAPPPGVEADEAVSLVEEAADIESDTAGNSAAAEAEPESVAAEDDADEVPSSAEDHVPQVASPSPDSEAVETPGEAAEPASRRMPRLDVFPRRPVDLSPMDGNGGRDPESNLPSTEEQAPAAEAEETPVPEAVDEVEAAPGDNGGEATPVVAGEDETEGSGTEPGLDPGSEGEDEPVPPRRHARRRRREEDATQAASEGTEPEEDPADVPGELAPVGAYEDGHHPAETSGLRASMRSVFGRSKTAHEHTFVESTTSVGLTRSVCLECGHVSIGVRD